jgi:hypothetical protein
MGRLNVLGLTPNSKFFSFLEVGYDYKDNEGNVNNWVEYSISYGMKSMNDFHNRKWDLINGKLDNSWITFNGRKHSKIQPQKLTEFTKPENSWLASNLKIHEVPTEM